MSIENIKFTTPEPVHSPSGIKFVRYWVLPDDEVIAKGFWKFWKENKTKMILRGFSMRKNKKTNRWRLEETKDRISDFKEYKKKPTINMECSWEVEPLSNPHGLREWQVPASAKLATSIRKFGSAIDGSDTGAGKTYTAIGAARELNMKVAVVCPKAVIESWKRVIKDHFGLEVVFVLNYEALKGGKYTDYIELKRKENSMITEYHWNLSKDTLIIFDESHRLKGKDTKNAQMAIAARRQAYKVLCCSATNAIDPLELNAVGYILGLHKCGLDFYRFAKDYGCIKGIGGLHFPGDNYSLKKLHKDIFVEKGVRLKKDEIPGFPDSDIIVDPYTIEDKDAAEIDRIYNEMENELSKLEKQSGPKTAVEMTIRLRARQKIELLKVPLIVEMAEDLIADGQSVVIMLNFSDSIKAVAKKLKTNCIVWGENKGDERQNNIDAFQADDERILILNIAAGGVGVSLHDLNGNHPRTALISPNDSAPLMRQAFGRVHRDGAKTKSQQRVLFIANTVEEQVCNNVKVKLTSLDRINDGDLNPKYEGMLRE